MQRLLTYSVHPYIQMLVDEGRGEQRGRGDEHEIVRSVRPRHGHHSHQEYH